MPADIREYLLERFTTDATTLRRRAESLGGSAKPSAGPNSEVSRAMADACDNVVLLAQELPDHAPVAVIIDALRLLVPKLTQLANSGDAASNPAIRSVYVGACTRVQELIAAESRAITSTTVDVIEGNEFDDDDLDDVDDADDDEDDDDDVDDDELHDDSQDDSQDDSRDDESRNTEQ